MSAPCRNCGNRHPGCHGECEAYHTFRKERDELNEKRKKASETESDFYAVRIKGKRSAQ